MKKKLLTLALAAALALSFCSKFFNSYKLKFNINYYSNSYI